MTHLTRRFDEALAYAREAHHGHFRKGTKIPYVAHLLGAAAIALEAGADEDQAIAALLHDVVEDQGGAPRLEDVRRRFGARVAAIVADCTDADTEPKPEWRPRKEAYLRSLAEKPAESLLVSLADKVHNAEAILGDASAIGEALWDRFTGGKAGTLWYYRALLEAFEARMAGTALVARLRRAVEGMEKEALRGAGVRLVR